MGRIEVYIWIFWKVLKNKIINAAVMMSCYAGNLTEIIPNTFKIIICINVDIWCVANTNNIKYGQIAMVSGLNIPYLVLVLSSTVMYNDYYMHVEKIP